MKLKKYLDFKFGNHTDSLSCILYMLSASFFATSYRQFWQNWNPLWSYFLLYYVYKPSRKYCPQPAALVLTFIISGLLHDCVAMLLTGRLSILMTLSFFLASLFVLIEIFMDINLKNSARSHRFVYQLTLLTLSACPIFILFW